MQSALGLAFNHGVNLPSAVFWGAGADMSPLEAGENASLVVKAAAEDERPFANLINQHLFAEGCLVQVRQLSLRFSSLLLFPGTPPFKVCVEVACLCR